MAARVELAKMLAKVAEGCRSLKERYRKAVSNYKTNYSVESKKAPGAAIEVTQDPNAMLQTLPQAIEVACLYEDAGVRSRPLSHQQLCVCADRMSTFVVMPLSKLLEECGGRPKGESLEDIRDQLVRRLPLIYVDAAPSTQGPTKTHSVFILNPYHVDGPRAWASMLASSARSFQIPEEISVDNTETDVDEDGEALTPHAGRPRVEDRYGEEFVDFMRTYVNTRGRMSLPDSTRMSDTLSSFTAPLKQIAVAAAAKGFPLAPSTVWRLFLPKRKNLVEPAQRGTIEARRATVELSDTSWGARCTWSANRVKVAEGWLALASQEGVSVAKYHLDECSKFNIWTAARSRTPMGFLLVDSEGKATITNWDHSFPLARGFLISLNGIVKCEANVSDAKSLSGDCDGKRFTPSQMCGFIRSHRYHPGSARAVHHDLHRALQLDEQGQKAEVGMFVSDNGGSYTLDSAVSQHFYERIFRSTQKAMVIVLAYHAGGSRFNWPIEQQWAQPRRKLAGVELGKHCVKDPHHPFEGFDDEEAALRHISDAAMEEIHRVLSSCKCGGNPWHIEAPTNDKDVLDDWDEVVAYYSASKTNKDCPIKYICL